MGSIIRPPRDAPWCTYCGATVQFPSSQKPWPWRLNNQDDILCYLHGLEAETEEWFLCFYVAQDLRLIAVEPPVKGTVNHVPVDTAQLIARSKQLEADGFVLVHNHPSGVPQPSAADINFTQRIRRIGNELNVPLLDHFILADKKLVRIGEWT